MILVLSFRNDSVARNHRLL